MADSALLIHSGDFKLFRLLDDHQAGKVLKAIMDYAESGAKPEGLDAAAMMLFTALVDKVDKDKAHYRTVCEKRAAAGRKGGRPRAEDEDEEKANAFSEKQTKANAFSEKQTKANAFSEKQTKANAFSEKQTKAKGETAYTETETETETESILADANSAGETPAASGQAMERRKAARSSPPKPSGPGEAVGKPIVPYPTRPEEVVAAAAVAGVPCTIEEAKEYLAANQEVGWVARDGRRVVDWRAGIRNFLTSPYRRLAKARLAQMPVAGAKAEMQRRMLEDAAANGQGATEDFR